MRLFLFTFGVCSGDASAFKLANREKLKPSVFCVGLHPYASSIPGAGRVCGRDVDCRLSARRQAVLWIDYCLCRTRALYSAHELLLSTQGAGLNQPRSLQPMFTANRRSTPGSRCSSNSLVNQVMLSLGFLPKGAEKRLVERRHQRSSTAGCCLPLC
ncbi:hypothetical protein NDU88_006142 [Pleurodeles waltl]|uniref:Secreted protein n=1 Tax=Pleurodeles waltl TaxID=8319 RepID=A0AAV7PKM3_PLEWA|nr:hypothetical protein NDU88_006142 [Pleurodeles waltl]